MQPVLPRPVMQQAAVDPDTSTTRPSCTVQPFALPSGKRQPCNSPGAGLMGGDNHERVATGLKTLQAHLVISVQKSLISSSIRLSRFGPYQALSSLGGANAPLSLASSRRGHASRLH